MARITQRKKQGSKGGSHEIFISHATADKPLADALIGLLETGIGIQTGQIFCTSFEEQGILPGKDFKAAIKRHLERSRFVLALVSLNYYQSAYCMCELGVTWSWKKRLIPLLVPPVDHNNLKGLLQGTQALVIDNGSQLDAMLGVLKPKKSQTVVRWNSRKSDFLSRLPKILESIKSITSTDGTQNPRYLNDMATLDERWKLPKIIDTRTVVIVVGSLVATELLDRPSAEMLRMRIDQKALALSAPTVFHRAIVIPDAAWEKARNFLQDKPLIAVGGSNANSITKWLETLKDQRKDYSEWLIAVDAHACFSTIHGMPQVTLHGHSAKTTREAVANYITRPEGLEAFLKLCWK